VLLLPGKPVPDRLAHHLRQADIPFKRYALHLAVLLLSYLNMQALESLHRRPLLANPGIFVPLRFTRPNRTH
jgi:hypothetical protein